MKYIQNGYLMKILSTIVILFLSFNLADDGANAQAVPKAIKFTPPDYSQCNLRYIFSIITNEFPVKTQFESDVVFLKRLDDTLKQHIGTNRLKEFACEIPSIAGNPAIKFDADKQVLSLNQSIDDGVILDFSSLDEAPTMGRTPLGVEIEYIPRRLVRYQLKWQKINIAHAPELKIDAKTAEREWENLSVALYGRIVPPYAKFETFTYEATIERRIEYRHLNNYVLFRPSKFVIWNKRPNTRLATFEIVKCPDGEYAAGVCKKPETLWFLR